MSSSGERGNVEVPVQDSFGKPVDSGAKDDGNSPPVQPEKDATEVVEVDGEEGSGTKNSPPALDRVATEPYNHQKVQEIARKKIAFALVGLVFLIILLSFLYLWVLPLSPNTKKYVENLILILQIIFGPIITLAGTAIGYYFGANGSSK